jgi:hypothetical protein
MLTKFLIIWILSFFVLCLPLLFITEKEKEEERKYKRSYLFIMASPITMNKKVNFVLNYTYILNLLCLIILPLIIGFSFNFTFLKIFLLYIIYLIIIMLIVTLFAFLNGINEKTKSKIVFHDIIFYTIILILFGPGFPGNTLAGLVVGKNYESL